MKNVSASRPGTVCHVLPCSIEEDLTAPVAQYFHPTPLPASSLPRSNLAPTQTASDSDDGTKKMTIMAAQFRGRGLLSAVDSPAQAPDDVDGDASRPPSCEDAGGASRPLSRIPSHMLGVVLSPSSGPIKTETPSDTVPTKPLRVMAKFEHIYNWKHEHDVRKVMAEPQENDKHGLNAVLGWCDLARAVSWQMFFPHSAHMLFGIICSLRLFPIDPCQAEVLK